MFMLENKFEIFCKTLPWQQIGGRIVAQRLLRQPKNFKINLGFEEEKNFKLPVLVQLAQRKWEQSRQHFEAAVESIPQFEAE